MEKNWFIEYKDDMKRIYVHKLFFYLIKKKV